jgi:hypothetical protein
MKEPYEKPEILTQEFSTQVFLANCFCANQQKAGKNTQLLCACSITTGSPPYCFNCKPDHTGNCYK